MHFMHKIVLVKKKERDLYPPDLRIAIGKKPKEKLF